MVNQNGVATPKRKKSMKRGENDGNNNEDISASLTKNDSVGSFEKIEFQPEMEEMKEEGKKEEEQEEEEKVPEMLPIVLPVIHESKAVQDQRAQRNQKRSTIAANAMTAIAHETKQQTLTRKASVQETVTDTLLGETLKWTFQCDPSINIQEIEEVIVTQGGKDGATGATGQLVDTFDGETGTISIYSTVDQKFNTEQDLLIGTTMISATKLSSTDFVKLSNKIVFEKNTT